MLGGAFWLVASLLHESGVQGVVVAALAWLGGINVLLGVLNVIPAAPLDGGRLLQAVLWAITKDRLKAAMWSARSGQAFGWALIVIGAYLVLARRDYNWLWFVLLGWFLVGAATRENQQAVVQSLLRTVAVREIMTADPVTVSASETVAQFLHDHLPWLRHSTFPVVADGQTVGLVTARRVNQVPVGPGSGRRAGRAGRSPSSRRRDDRGDQRAGHGRLPGRDAGPVSAGNRPQPSARPSACSRGALKRVMYHHSGCPRGDLNTDSGAISPDRGNHRTKVTRAGLGCPAIKRRVRCPASSGLAAGGVAIGAAPNRRCPPAAGRDDFRSQPLSASGLPAIAKQF